MTPEGIAPPEPEACLARPYPSSQKGGTIVVGEVIDLETHKRLLANPDGYRPSSCPACGGLNLHRHEFRERKPKGEGMPPVLTIAVFMCARCTATWRVLPGFLPRHLWHTWQVVGSRTEAQPAPKHPDSVKPSERTVKRWNGRLAARAKQLVLLLAASFGARLQRVAIAVGTEATRRELVAAFGELTTSPLEALSALVHRLEPGVRVM